MDSTTAWKAIGRDLELWRETWEPNRQAFADQTELNYRLIYDLERGRRSNFARSTQKRIETAYRIPHGWIAQAVQAAMDDQPLPPKPAPGDTPTSPGIEYLPDPPQVAFREDPSWREGLRAWPDPYTEGMTWLEMRWMKGQARRGFRTSVAPGSSLSAAVQELERKRDDDSGKVD